MSEVFDSQLHDYLKYLEESDESLNCDLYNKSNCCEAPFYDETDVCTECLEHAASVCTDCQIECNNDNRE